MAGTLLGNISICNSCIHQHVSYFVDQNYCDKSEIAGIEIKPGYLPKCSYYCPIMTSTSPGHLTFSILADRNKDYDGIKRVIFKDPLTIVLWNDGDKTIVKCQEGDIYDPEKGLAMAICKYVHGNKSRYNEIFKKWLPEEKEND